MRRSARRWSDYLGDTVIEFEITPNLVHDYSIVGVAREAAAVLRTTFRDPFPRWADEPLDVPDVPGIVTVEDTHTLPALHRAAGRRM